MREPGVYASIPEDEYHADRDSLSASGAKLLLQAPAKFRYEQDHPKKPKKVYDFGHLAHLKLLGIGPEIVPLDPAVHGLKKDGSPADNPKATAGWQKAEKEARERGAIPVSVDEVEKAELMAAAVMQHSAAGPLFVEGHPETSLYTEDPRSGLLLRGRLDWMTMVSTHVVVVEFKTADDASKRVWERRAYNYGYHIPAAWYLELATLLGIDDRPEFLYVVAEKEPPYLVAVYSPDAELLAEGRARMRDAINIYLECSYANVWPGYSDEIETLSLPWAHTTTTREE